jgi:hypothetical protein
VRRGGRRLRRLLRLQDLRPLRETDARHAPRAGSACACSCACAAAAAAAAALSRACKPGKRRVGVAAQLLHAVLERRDNALGCRPNCGHERLLRGGELGRHCGGSGARCRGGRAEARCRHGRVGVFVIAVAAEDACRVVELVVLVVLVVRVHFLKSQRCLDDPQ